MYVGSSYKVSDVGREALRGIRTAIASEAAALAFLEKARWDEAPACPRCGDMDVYAMRDRETGERERHYRLRCRGCERQFSVRTGTVMERTNLPLTAWCHAMWLQVSSKKGVSALQVSRTVGVSYKWALFLCHRIRHALAEDLDQPVRKMTGIIEADETFFGPKRRHRNRSPRLRSKRKEKIPVIGLVERGGELRAKPTDKVTSRNVHAFLRANTDMGQSALSTDEAPVYRSIGRRFKRGHHRVRHSSYEFVKEPQRPHMVLAHTNTMECFWNLLKKRINGTHHSVSKVHFHRYVSEAAFLWNTRMLDDGERLLLAILKADGKRLAYRKAG